MSEKTKPGKTSEDYLRTLAEVKKQYQQYVEISGLYKLPVKKQEEKTPQYLPPSPDNPLTTNRIPSD